MIRSTGKEIYKKKNNYAVSYKYQASPPSNTSRSLSNTPSLVSSDLVADNLLVQKKFNQANSELERAYRITKQDGALFLRLAHLRYRQGLLQESESFASKGLLLSNISSWERLLLNVYLKN